MPPANLRVVALVCSYWPNRRSSVQRIVDDLLAGSRIPDHILVLNNHPDVLTVEGADVIHAGFNTTCRGKFIAALLDVADYYLLLDDDTSVGFRTLEALLRHARRGICTGYLGCWVNADGTVSAPVRHLWPYNALEETACDTFCGCAMFMAFDALVRMLILEERVRIGGRWPHQGDDLIAGLANAATVVPLHDEERFVDLGYMDQAMCYSDEHYYGMRDELVRYVLAVLAVHPMPLW